MDLTPDPKLNFRVEPQRTAGILYDFYEAIPAATSMPRSDDTPIEIYINGNENQMTDIAGSFLQLEVEIKTVDDKKIPNTTENLIFPCELFLYNVFKLIEGKKKNF